MENDLPFTIPGLDVQQGLEVFGGDVETYISTLHSFLKNTPEVVHTLRGVTKERLPDYAINVHGLKSSSGWIGAENLQARAVELETLAKSGDISGVLAQNDSFLNDVDALIQTLRVVLKDYPEE